MNARGKKLRLSKAQPSKSFLPRFFTKKRAGSRGGALAARRSARNSPCAHKAQEGVKGGTLAGGSPFAGGLSRPQPHAHRRNVGGHPSPPGGGFWLGGTRRFGLLDFRLVLPVPPHFFGLAQRNGVEPQRKALLGGGAPVRFRDPPASPTRVGGATRPLRCPLRGLILSLAPGARGLGWRKFGPVKVLCPALL